MRHLKLETLARLVDEAADPVETAHLETCAACRGELEALRDQTESLGTLPELMPSPDAWPELRQRLGAEGLVRGGGRHLPRRVPLQVAAAVVLFLAGGALGFAIRGPGDGAAGAADPVVAQAENPPDPPAGGQKSATLSEEVERTEELFAAALDRYMEASDTRAPDPAARLAALDHIVLTTAEALNTSPADPVLNSYHLTAVAQRKALIRQLSASREPTF